jgi:hypothetical protein
MAKKKVSKPQLYTLPKAQALPEMSFDLVKADQFVRSLGVLFTHYRAIPSPIGLKDRGEYRRSDSIDHLQENGMIYRSCGNFTATLVSNSSNKRTVEGGIYDQSTARIIMPRFYDADSASHAGEEIHVCVGDRIYVKDLEVKVVNYQRVEYNPNYSDYLQYPALCVEFLMDSRGLEYQEGVHFKLDRNGNIQWIEGRNNPGIDPDTGKGRVYSVRYKYNAHWYISSVPNEIRITNTTVGDTRSPARMAYHIQVQREYVYHTTPRKDNEPEPTRQTEPSRKVQKPTQSVPVNDFTVQVNVGNFSEDD